MNRKETLAYVQAGIKGYGAPDYRKGIAYLGEMDGLHVLTFRWARGPFRTDMKAVRHA